jgi:hypothetical protein
MEGVTLPRVCGPIYRNLLVSVFSVMATGIAPLIPGVGVAN